jgi:signal transduction histidine kinase
VQLAMHDLQNAVSLLEVSMESLHFGMTYLCPREVAAVRDARLASRRIQRYVDHLVTSERLAKGTAGVRRDRVALTDLLMELANEYRHLARSRGCALTVDVDDASRVIALGDEVLITRVLQNLMENALVHGPPGGRVHVIARSSGGAELRFCSEGARIEPERRETIFDKYAGTPRRGGSGMGLYFSGQVARAHGGKLSVEDEVGWPVCFVLRLPGPPRPLT